MFISPYCLVSNIGSLYLKYLSPFIVLWVIINIGSLYLKDLSPFVFWNIWAISSIRTVYFSPLFSLLRNMCCLDHTLSLSFLLEIMGFLDDILSYLCWKLWAVWTMYLVYLFLLGIRGWLVLFAFLEFWDIWLFIKISLV